MVEATETTFKTLCVLHSTRNSFNWYYTCPYSSVHGTRWCADSWDTMEQSELPPMQSLAKAQEPSG